LFILFWGQMDVWDLLDSSTGPVLSVNVCSPAPVLCAIPRHYNDEQSFLAAGGHDGTMHVFLLPLPFVRPGQLEFMTIRRFLDREIARVCIFLFFFFFYSTG
jgi:hypothetical protein